MENSPWIRSLGSTPDQLVKYAVVGVFGNLVAYLIYLFLTATGVSPKFAMTLVYAVAASVGFLGNRRLTFRHRDGMRSAVIRYVLAHLCGYLLNFVVLSYFVDHLGYSHQCVQAGGILLVAAFLFLAFKLFVFRIRGDAAIS